MDGRRCCPRTFDNFDLRSRMSEPLSAAWVLSSGQVAIGYQLTKSPAVAGYGRGFSLRARHWERMARRAVCNLQLTPN
jgi:hypothetical protein